MTYEVSVSTCGRSISIEIDDGLFIGCFFAMVDPPNIIERLFGISFESKVNKVLKSAQVKCDKMNLETELAKRALTNTQEGIND